MALAVHSPTMALALALLLSLSSISSISAATVECEKLSQERCAFAVSAEAKRCVLESAPRADGITEYQCRTSEVRVEKLANWIETDECVNSCGLDRSAAGISSDGLFDADFIAKLCDPSCYQNCPNIVDLYFNLAAAEGTFLPELCVMQKSSPRRSMEGFETSALSPGSSPSLAIGAFGPVLEPAAPPSGF